MKRRKMRPPDLFVYLVVGEVLAVVIGFLFYLEAVSRNVSNSSSGVVESTGAVGITAWFFGLSLGGLVGAFVVWVFAYNRHERDPDVRSSRKKRIEEARRLQRERIRRNHAAQLNKVGYDQRLTKFLKGVDELCEPDQSPFVSKMPFWQLRDFGERTLPKPIELIRTLLLRIHRLVRSA